MDFHANHFQLFDLPAHFRLDTEKLEAAYRKLQNEVHPDRFAAASETEKRLSMQWATRVNEAFQTLKKPLARGAYLLHLHGIEAFSEKHTSFPPDFLMQQMAWREAIGDARQSRDVAALDRLARELRNEAKRMEEQLAAELDDENDYEAAAATARKLKFMHKLIEEIGDAQEEMENA
ncbi:MAG: Fe-S protein assembly co-chaperone HscB [Pseudomonadota bacterium]